MPIPDEAPVMSAVLLVVDSVVKINFHSRFVDSKIKNPVEGCQVKTFLSLDLAHTNT